MTRWTWEIRNLPDSPSTVDRPLLAALRAIANQLSYAEAHFVPEKGVYLLRIPCGQCHAHQADGVARAIIQQVAHRTLHEMTVRLTFESVFYTYIVLADQDRQSASL